MLRLSELLSYMLYECNGEKVSLSKEIDLIKNYLELKKMRFNDRIKIKLNIEGELHKHEIAPLLLLPFVENAFKHGVSSNSEQAWINISLIVKNDELLYQVENSLPINSEKDELKSISHGIGLTNINKRLIALYPDHTLETNNNETHKATLRLAV